MDLFLYYRDLCHENVKSMLLSETNSLLKQIETLTFIVGSLQIHPLFIEYPLGYWGNINLSVTDIRFLEVHNAHFSLLFGRYWPGYTKEI